MKQSLVLWRTAWRAGTNTLLYDGRMRVGKVLALSFQLGSGIWACLRLFLAFQDWQHAHTLSGELWPVCFTAWSIIALFAILATFTLGLNSNEALLLATLPLAPGIRLRSLYGLILFKEGGNWLLWEVGILGLALAPVIGWLALFWVAVLAVGAALLVWLVLVATLLVLRFLLARSRVLWGGLLGMLGFCVLLLLLLHQAGSLCAWLLPVWILSGRFISLLIAWPVLILGGMLLCLLLALLPLASATGQLYLATLLLWQKRAQRARAFIFPGISLLIAPLARSRTLSAALLVRGLLSQSRHWLAWVRLLVLLLLLLLFEPIHEATLPLHLTPSLFIAAYSALTVALILLEYVPYSISSEGSRLALYMTLPRGMTAFLRARLLSFLLPALALGLLLALLGSLWIHLSLLDLGVALLIVLLVVPGYIVFTVLGSALDEDLTLAIEDPAHALMAEEMPITPRRVQLLSLTVVLLGSCFWLLWKLPFIVALPALLLIDITILWLIWRLSAAYLARLLH